MAILLDDEARTVITHRRAHGRDVTILLYLRPLRGWQHMLCVGWGAHHVGAGTLISQQIGDIRLCVHRRVARYAQWHDVTLSAWHLGPLEGLTVVDEPCVVLDMLAWEQDHPGLRS